MNKFTEQFNTEAKNARLTDAERSRIRMALDEAMDANASVPSPYFISSFLWTRAVIAVALILVVGGGTAYAAEGALPGDILYSIKVSVNEPVSGAFAFTDEAKAGWHADIAEARLSEAEALADKGELTASTSDELAANFNEHADALAKITTDIDGTRGRNLSSRFSSIVAHRGAAILAAGKRSKNTIALRASGDFVVNVAGGESKEHQTDTAVSAAVPTLMKASLKTAEPGADAVDTSFAESLSLRAHAAFSDATTTLARVTLSESDVSKSEHHLSEIENLIVKADAELSIGNVADATDDFNEALRELTSFDASIEASTSSDSNSDTDSSDGIKTSIHSELNGAGPAIPHF